MWSVTSGAIIAKFLKSGRQDGVNVWLIIASMQFRPGDIDPMRFYGYMIGAIIPRPIAFVSTVGKTGVRNLAPFSFFTVASVDPPVVCFSPIIRGDLQKKDTLKNIEATGEFVLNIVSESFAEGVNKCAAEIDYEIDEFEISGLTPVPSKLVNAPRVKESHIHIECRLREVIRFGDHYLAGNLVLGDILLIDIDDAVITETMGLQLIDPSKLKSFGRMAGAAYARTTDLFELERPAARPYTPRS
jgi:flavin reductase (DIM6/NTAB) family NADH-FMN oxidoreductase RutF